MNVFDGTTVRPSINLGHDPRVKIDWSDPDGFRPFYTKLLQLHRAHPALHQPGMADFRKLDVRGSDRAYAFIRRHDERAVVVVTNLSDQSIAITLEPAPNAGGIDGAYVELFGELPTDLHAGKTLALEPWGYRVFVR
jgi:hypothetical protein